MTDWELKEGERLDDLVRDGMKLIQRPDQFCFSIDSVLLAHYPAIKAKDKICDLGTGTGVIALLMSALGGRDITALEVNPVMADLAARNVKGNGKESVIHVVPCDYRKVNAYFPSGSFSLVVVNPPYREVGSGKMSENQGVAGASYELYATLEEVFKTSRYLLKYGGRPWYIGPTARRTSLPWDGNTAWNPKGCDLSTQGKGIMRCGCSWNGNTGDMRKWQ